MFAGVEILNDCNYVGKERNGEYLSVPEIQVCEWIIWEIALSKTIQIYKISFHKMSLVYNEETVMTDLTTSEQKTTIKPHDIKSSVEKEKWAKDIEFLLSCIALSVGLGNVWR